MNFITKELIFALLISIFNIVYIAEGLARFTKVPTSVLYVSVGKTAWFVWDYTVDNRSNDFQEMSPRWSFYEPKNSESIIGYELVFEQRKWTINNKTCPKRLLNPTRVSREPNATLVIENVTIADSGTYGCSLMLTTRDPITSKVNLVVTTIPKITISTISTIRINESDSMDIRCSATGNPRPNVTWISLAVDIIMSEEVGNATLRIKNITKRQGGGYQCRASNSPNEKPVTMEIKIVVLFKPQIDTVKATRAAAASNKKENISLQCVATGQPLPRITWYGPRGRQIVSGIDNTTERSVLTFETKNSSDYGRYTCRAENKIGKDEHFINVTQSSSTESSSVDRENGNKPTTYRGTTRVTKQVSPSVIRENDNQPTTFRGTARVTKQATTQVAIASRRRRKSITPVVGAIIGVGLLIAIAIGLTLFIITKKTCMSKKQDGTNNRIDNNRNTRCPSHIETDEREIPVYAQVDTSMKMKTNQEDVMPIYAQVDKSKKKRPGQIIYAELEDFKYSEEMSSVVFPPEYKETEYADVQGLSNQENNEPIYERI